jgi:hypothetical protein
VTELIAYASRTGTRKNLHGLREAGWRLLVSAQGVLRHEGFPYALDNGAWTAFASGQPFDVPKFEHALATMGGDADWVVAPDIVAGGLASLRLSETWLERCLAVCPKVLVAVQDGICPDDLRSLVGPQVGVFVGGSPSTNYKEATMPAWGDLGHEKNCHVHVGRVNSARRIWLCGVSGVHSFDGTNATIYSVNLRSLDGARRQGAFRWR